MENNTIKKTALAGITAAGIIAAAFLVPFEGEKYVAYADIGGVWTICNGHTLGVTQGQVATKKECERFRAEDIARAEAIYDAVVVYKHPDNVKAACLDFIYNVGGGAFRGSTLLKKLNHGDRAGACAQFPRWSWVAGKDCNVKQNGCGGIPVRRKSEKELCLDQNIYYRFAFGADNLLHGVRSPSP